MDVSDIGWRAGLLVLEYLLLTRVTLVPQRPLRRGQHAGAHRLVHGFAPGLFDTHVSLRDHLLNLLEASLQIILKQKSDFTVTTTVAAQNFLMYLCDVVVKSSHTVHKFKELSSLRYIYCICSGFVKVKPVSLHTRIYKTVCNRGNIIRTSRDARAYVNERTLANDKRYILIS